MITCENDEIACPACNENFPITTILKHIKKRPTKKGCGEKITNKDHDAINDICEKRRKRKKREHNALRKKVQCENDKIACPACNEKFSIATITRHIEIDPTKKGCGEKITSKDRDALNDICEKRRKRKKREHNALRRKVQCENDEIACPVCNKKFSMTTITRHIKIDPTKKGCGEKISNEDHDAINDICEEQRKRKKRKLNKKYYSNNSSTLLRKIKTKMRKGKNNMTKEDRLLAFKYNIIEGPNFVCHSCNRCLFIKSVRILSDLTLKNLKKKLDTPFLKAISFEKLQKSKQSILCINCLKLIRKKKIPNTNVSNGLQLEDVPASLKLTDLEQQLIARNLLFLKIKQLPTSRMTANYDNVVSVPIELEDVYKTESLLPRHPNNAKIVAVQLKRKLELKNSHLQEHIRPSIVLDALETLKNLGNPFYQEIEINNEFMEKKDFATSDDEDFHENVIAFNESVANPDVIQKNEAINEADAIPSMNDLNENNKKVENDDESDFMLDAVKKYQSNQDSNTCLFPRDMANTMVVNNSKKMMSRSKGEGLQSIKVAPGEGKTPTSLMRNEHFDVKSFPKHYPSGKYGLHHERKFRLSPVYYFNQRLLNADERFSKDICYLFMASYYIERFGLERAINVSG